MFLLSLFLWLLYHQLSFFSSPSFIALYKCSHSWIFSNILFFKIFPIELYKLNILNLITYIYSNSNKFRPLLSLSGLSIPKFCHILFCSFSRKRSYLHYIIKLLYKKKKKIWFSRHVAISKWSPFSQPIKQSQTVWFYWYNLSKIHSVTPKEHSSGWNL